MNKFTHAKMRHLNDEICVAHGLKVLTPYDPHNTSINLGHREYRAQEMVNCINSTMQDWEQAITKQTTQV